MSSWNSLFLLKNLIQLECMFLFVWIHMPLLITSWQVHSEDGPANISVAHVWYFCSQLEEQLGPWPNLLSLLEGLIQWLWFKSNLFVMVTTIWEYRLFSSFVSSMFRHSCLSIVSFLHVYTFLFIGSRLGFSLFLSLLSDKDNEGEQESKWALDVFYSFFHPFF